MLRVVLLLCLMFCISSYKLINYNNNKYKCNNNINKRLIMRMNKVPVQSIPPSNEQQEDKTKYFIALAVFVAAACFDKFVYHADPAHDDALYSSVNKVTKE